MTINREMPRYVCHKQVWALKIASLKEGVEDKNSVLMSFSDEGYAPIHVDFDWYYRHKPEAGGYYVVYRDGYKSYSPAKAFEDGYTLQSGAPAAQAEHQDPTDYKAMFQQAVSSLAAISEAIGIPDDEAATGEPEIIIDFIRELRRERDEAVDAGYATPQPAAQAAPAVVAAYPVQTGRREGRLAKRPYQPGDTLPAINSFCLVSGVNCDIESDQHRSYSWRKVIGYSGDHAFICLQTDGCWPTVERTGNCWFAEIPHALTTQGAGHV